MIESQTKSIKAKDIDINRLTKRVQRLEKMVEVNKNMDAIPLNKPRSKNDKRPRIQEVDE
jgi:archaellum component FlaC